MTSATERLVQLVGARDCFDIAPAELLPVQLEAANERLQSQTECNPLLANRAGAVKEIKRPADLVPLLFAHTTYKTYAEGWLSEGQWDRMGKWLATVSTRAVDGLDTAGVQTLDDWIKQLETVGHYLSCSSGTTGKPAMLSCTEGDVELSARINIEALLWATGLTRGEDRKFLGLGPQFAAPREDAIRQAMVDCFSSRYPPYQFGDGEPITVGSMVDIITLRRKLADGTARPSEIAEFERIATQRANDMGNSAKKAVDAVIEARELPLLGAGMFATLYQIAEGINAKGHGGGDFNPDNALMVAGGLKGAALPENYREYVLETFNVAEGRLFHAYSMREINAVFPLCCVQRYHISPWVILLPLDTAGEQLLDTFDGEIESRAAFFDASIEGRWGGVISGDRVSVSYAKCRCGHQGPTIGREITRYADLPGGDKITCAGSIDAYVRGVA
ncbi:hypothetical protein AWC05_27940 [Mycobacterium florentinum]|uniref:Acyl-protein synthetase LuxE domain-containing protein n=1 Tax=Mycobacterium florentinum TaxID=292462 RepID=A0A1X1U3H6_MYCFL|nr:hypothetical protein [Mycobacterium florentinum]MCV7411234.1 hypothetical protein [Mycobacterium florentinum]ORV51390.1 hypothetical protein AWC05_27940 [Mycobacterium florentinum]BBX80585.1 hypothetical protein MFLOJ_43720 [Mycobacterium florentinum]